MNASPRTRGSLVSDERLRALEREYRATGTGEATWLKERARAGGIASERLWLAAYVGHPAAVEVFYEGETHQAWTPTNAEQVDCWVRGLEQWGQTTLVRAATAVAWATLGQEIDKPEFRAALAMAENWVIDPTLKNAFRANSSTSKAGEVALAAFDRHEMGREPTLDDPGALVFCVGALATTSTSVAHWCAGRHAAWIASWPGDSVEKGDQFEEIRPAVKVGRAVARAARLAGLAVVVGPIQAELSSFALGYSDPVRERVKAREREAAGE